MPPKLDDLFASPDHYLHSFEAEAAVFVQMDRAAYHRSIFLDGRISPAGAQRKSISVPGLLRDQPVAQRTAWIFHMAHCGSTLLARGLDDPNANLVLREPLALRQLAIRPDPGRLALILAMLGKRYQVDAPTLVKANVPVNFLLPQLALADVDARMILMYLPLRAYLLAILRTEDHRKWLRNVTLQLRLYLGDLSSFVDAERAALLWLAQINAFSRTVANMRNARALDAETFFTEPREVLYMAARHLALPLSEAALTAKVMDPLLGSYSKNPTVAFDNIKRITRQGEAEQIIGPEIAIAETWIANHATQAQPEASLVAAALNQR